ncbi:MAG: glycosyltransferase family 4 protein [Lachnospiraceae bacterium]|nr:glycosyltransferase family 4 protein [Candidatus Minthocola equi]
MKILIIMGGFFPGKKYGGPPVSVNNFCSLMKECDCYIYTHNHDLGETDIYDSVTSGWNDYGNCKVMYVDDKQYNITGFQNVINDINPDIIYLQGLFQSCTLPCLAIAKKKKIKVFLAPRGELCAGALAIKKYKKLPYIYFLKIAGLVQKVFFQSTSDEETDAIHSLLNVSIDRIHFLANIPSIPSQNYKRLYKRPGEGKFVFLARIHPKKNLVSAIRYFKSINGNVQFDIYGPIEDEEYWKECQKEIATLPNNVIVKYCGLVPHDKVHETFSQYDAFVFPTFSENYGHVIAESIVVGTPVVLTKGTTPWDDIDGVAGKTIANANFDEATKYLNKIVDMNDLEAQQLVLNTKRYANSKLGTNTICNQYTEVLNIIQFWEQ